MSNGIAAETGPFMHAIDAKATKSFGDRTFTVLIAGAYNAGGLIGSEYNGIVVIDDDLRTVLLQRHLPTGSGYNGPTQGQREEMKRILDMDWKAFTGFLASAPGYRGGLPDIDQAEPDQSLSAKSRIPSREIFPLSIRDAACPYAMPLSDRRDIIEHLTKHSMHRIDGPYSDVALAWEIKVGGFDSSGKVEGIAVDAAYDARWEALVENDEYLFGTACEDALRGYVDGEYTLWDGKKPVDMEVGTAGRQGGWLVLNRFNGHSATFESVSSLEEMLNEMDDADLVELYKLTVQLDEDLSPSKRNAEMAYQYASRRQSEEEAWAEEAAPAR